MNDTQEDPRDTVQAMKEMVLHAALFGDTLKELSVRKQLDEVMAEQGITDIEARVLMAANDQLIGCIRNGMGLNQALLWMCNAAWPSRIGHQVLARIGG